MFSLTELLSLPQTPEHLLGVVKYGSLGIFNFYYIYTYKITVQIKVISSKCFSFSLLGACKYDWEPAHKTPGWAKKKPGSGNGDSEGNGRRHVTTAHGERRTSHVGYSSFAREGYGFHFCDFNLFSILVLNAWPPHICSQGQGSASTSLNKRFDKVQMKPN